MHTKHIGKEDFIVHLNAERVKLFTYLFHFGCTYIYTSQCHCLFFFSFFKCLLFCVVALVLLSLFHTHSNLHSNLHMYVKLKRGRLGRRRAVTFVAVRIIQGSNGDLLARALKGEKEHKRRCFWYTKEQVPEVNLYIS
jgi:hypothetical protein